MHSAKIRCQQRYLAEGMPDVGVRGKNLPGETARLRTAKGEKDKGKRMDETRSAGAPGEAAGEARGGCALVALVGAGPGDPGLITVRGRELLCRADAVVYDRLVASELVELAVRARRIDVGKRQGSHPVPQHRINEILVEEARRVGAGGLVVRLKGGDPYLFGRGGEEASYLAQRGVPFEVVPGITSAFAAPSYAGIPVTDRRAAASVHVVTGHRQQNGALDIDFGALVQAGGTLVFLMAVATLGEICAGLLAAGMPADTPAAVVERGTTARQRTVRGAVVGIARKARQTSIQSPAVLVVGAVAGLDPELAWYDRLPLRGKTILVTRPRDRAAGLAEKLARLGAEVLCFPCVEMYTAADEDLASVVRRIGSCGWLALTSPFGARCLARGVRAAGLDARALAGVRVAAIGPATAAALERELAVRADYVPEVYDSAHLGAGLARLAAGEKGASPARVMLFRSSEGSPVLPRALEEAGVAYEEVEAYRSVTAPEPVPAELVEKLSAGTIDLVTFTSASTVKGFAQALTAAGADPAHAPRKAVCLGLPTRAAAEAAGFMCTTASAATMSDLADACVRALADSKGEQ